MWTHVIKLSLYSEDIKYAHNVNMSIIIRLCVFIYSEEALEVVLVCFIMWEFIRTRKRVQNNQVFVLRSMPLTSRFMSSIVWPLTQSIYIQPLEPYFIVF